jgi:hypothetical protein
MTATNPAVVFHRCRVFPGPIIDAGLWLKHGKMVSSFSMAFMARVARGN